MSRPNRARARAKALTNDVHRWIWLSFFIVFATLAFASVAHAEKELVRGNAGEPKSLDPHRASGTWENNIIGDMMLGLYTEAANGDPILGAADDAKTSPDGLRWTFHIRPHTWSDGKPVTAGDFVYAFRRILNPSFGAEYCEILFPIKNARKVNDARTNTPLTELGVSAPDDQTLIIDLENPAPYLPQLLTHYTAYPLPKHVVEKYESDWIKQGKIVSNGPYMLKEWRPHDHITLVKNPMFYDAANVKIDRVVYLPLEDDLTAFRRYRAGEVDLQERWPLTELKWVKKNIPTEARKFPYLSVTYFTFNTTKKPFNDFRVRKAIAEAIDRQSIAKDVFFGAYGEEAFSFLPPGLPGVDHSAEVPYRNLAMDARIEDAKKLLATAGYGPGKPLKFTYNFIGYPDAKRAAVSIQSMMRKIGVEMELLPAEPKVHYDVLKTKSYEAANAAWVFDFSDAKNMLYLFQSSTNQQNYPGYKNPEFDKLMDMADAEPDGAKRATLLGRANGLLMRDLPAAPMFHQYQRTLVKPYVLNFVENPRIIFRSRWMDIGNKPKTSAYNDDGDGSEGGSFWSWLGSWFSPTAWTKWWNS